MVQANATVQGFVQALRDADWTKAIGYCSAKVRQDAKAYPSPEAFFRDVVPITQITAQTKNPIYLRSGDPGKGGAWSLYPLAYRVAELEPDPADKWPLKIFREAWWQGRIEKSEGEGWAVDFPTTPLRTHIEKRLVDLKRVRDEAIATETELEPKLKDLHTRLTPLASTFQAGSPMLFRLELVNDGPAKLIYKPGAVGVNSSFIVMTSAGHPAKYTGPPTQTGLRHDIIEPGRTAVLLDNWDLANQYRLTEPGRYTVQFRGGVGIAEPHPHKTELVHRSSDRIESQPAEGKRSLRLFPSNAVEIEVTAPPPGTAPAK